QGVYKCDGFYIFHILAMAASSRTFKGRLLHEGLRPDTPERIDGYGEPLQQKIKKIPCGKPSFFQTKRQSAGKREG
ncbi:hypothetical protein, partial [Akkermansia sp.]|uniref:hypothetical protein n=1 Tax=Akkermansia sp. TaxID=1872421 RepID=UPI003AB49FD3